MRRAEVVFALTALALGGCTLAPTLEVPAVPLAGSFKEEAPWTTAQPADEKPREAWWTVYGDADLDALQKRLVDNSPDLAAALARYQQSQAITEQLRSGLFPTLAGTAGVQRVRDTGADFTSRAVGVQVDYEFDLWGRIRNQVASGKASEDAARADLESARLSLQAQLADNFVTLRGLDREVALLTDTVTAYSRAFDLTSSRKEGGIASGLDVARAETQLHSARSLVDQTAAQRALIEHGIAALIGESASQFTIAPRLAEIRLPRIPAGLPSTLLQRRPDIAGAQRRIAAANANVGVARAAYFPAVTLGGTAGYLRDGPGNLVSAPNLYWTIGPALFLTLFDAGKRQAQVAQARAVLDETGANYRGTVLAAFQQVEDNLALLSHYRVAAESQRAAVEAAQRSLDLATSRYRLGAVNYLEVVTSQAAALQAQRDALDLDTRQRRASVQLVRALGGGW
jgi:NodT family efflux transporter outer membrane factor (OMF) lipoprotein